MYVPTNYISANLHFVQRMCLGMFVIDQLDVTIFIPLFSLYMFRIILVHHQEICYVRHAGLTL
jgi:hypothetical protein